MSMVNGYDTLVQVISQNFFPKNVTSEQEAEKELLYFINKRFPQMVTRPGHTTSGTQIDIVIDGTYAIELVLVDSESRLISFMHQIIEVKESFFKAIVIFVDPGKLPEESINRYIQECEGIGINPIVKRVRA